MHDPTHEYDDNCEGCQPALLDVQTGIPYQKDSPVMQAILKAWKEQVTLTERRAWHRVILQGSKSPNDQHIAQKVVHILQAAMQEVE